MIRPVNGLAIANQNGIASLKGIESRRRREECTFATGRDVEEELIVFMRSSLLFDPAAAMARVWDFQVLPWS